MHCSAAVRWVAMAGETLENSRGQCSRRDKEVVLPPPCVHRGTGVCVHTNVKMNDIFKS